LENGKIRKDDQNLKIKMQNKIFKKELSVIEKPKVSIEKRGKRREKSWTFIRYVFGVLLAVFAFIIGVLDVQLIYKLFLFVIGIIFLIWLCFLNSCSQNKIIRMQIKIEETWRKI